MDENIMKKKKNIDINIAGLKVNEYVNVDGIKIQKVDDGSVNIHLTREFELSCFNSQR